MTAGGATAGRPEPGALAQAWAVLRRELAVERAGRDGLVTVAPYVLAAVLLLGLGAGARLDVLGPVAPALVWLLVLTAAAPLARGVRAAEQDDQAWDVLRALARPQALLVGKTAALWLQLALAWALAAGLSIAALGARLPVAAVLAGLLGTLGLAADVVLLGMLLGGTTRRSGLLAALVLPAGVPQLLAGTQVGEPGSPVLPWLALLVVVDALALVLAWVLLPVLLEE